MSELKNLQIYNKEIKKYKVLSKKEEQELFVLIKNNDKEAKDKIIKHNLRLVLKVVLEYKNSDISLCDLIQEGNIGLIKAVDKFDYTKGYRFNTYAVFVIKEYIQREIYKSKRLIPLPVRRVKNLTKINRKFKDKFNSKIEEISDFLNMSFEQTEDLLLSEKTYIPLDNKIEKFLLDENTDCPIKRIKNIETNNIIKNIFSSINDKDKKILNLRYCYDKSLRETGKIVGLSHESIRSAEKRLFKTLGRKLKNYKLEELI